MSDDDEDQPEDKPSHLKVVSDNPRARADREIDRAKVEAQRALSQFGAAMLRAMAGNDAEAAYLTRRLSILVEAINKFQKQADRGMSVRELQEALLMPRSEMDDPSDDEWRHRRWLQQDGFDDIVKGALRLAAHKLLREEPAFGGMHSERVIEQGIKTLEELKRPLPPPKPQPRTKKDPAAGWDDVGLDSPAKRVERKLEERLGRARAQTKLGRQRAGFDQDDLKELRKAIKVKDNKRIAELTAKIGRPSIDEPK